MPDLSPLVLVADDEPSMLELVARHLKTMHNPKLEVIQASDGEEAWRLAREHLPDLVVLDVMMPGMSGWEVCRKIREDVALAHTGVVMLTGIGENLNQLTSPLYGADAYIDKPFEFTDLDVKVRATLDARRSAREGVLRPKINGTIGAAKPAKITLDDEPPTSIMPESRPKKAAAAPAKKGPSVKKAAAKPAAKAAPAKAAPKKAAKKATPKKAAPKKAAPKKAAPKKSVAKKAAPKKKAPAKKTAKKPAKKSKKK